MEEDDDGIEMDDLECETFTHNNNNSLTDAKTNATQTTGQRSVNINAP